jgi:3-hydroxyacyl-CoA dehydrogenase
MSELENLKWANKTNAEQVQRQRERIAVAEQETLIKHLNDSDAAAVRSRQWYDEAVKERDELRELVREVIDSHKTLDWVKRAKKVLGVS